MTHRMRLKASAGIIAVVILLSFALSVPHTRDTGPQTVLETAVAVPAVTIRDSFRKGVHTISGTVEAANACASVNAEASLVGNASGTEGITVALTLERQPGVCLELPTPLRFETSIEAPADLPLTVTVNGAPASTSAP